MQIWEAVVLGVVQGLTEFLPISSTAHLVIVRQAMRHPHPDDAFTTVIQLGTLVAVFAYFRHDILNMLRALLGDIKAMKLASSPASKMGWLIVLGSVPVGIVGVLFKKKIKEIFYDLPTMGIVAILFAVLMLAAELWHKIRTVDLNKPGVEENQITWKDAFWIGCWQMLAVMPGASRSGTTLTGAFFAGLTRPAAARFSFLLSLPSILAAGVKELYDEYKLYKNPKPDEAPSLFASGDETTALIVATVVSGVIGYFAIAWLVGYLKKYNMGVFIAYRLLLGIGILVWWFGIK
jgi:undecaprenyl-diphosphatase